MKNKLIADIENAQLKQDIPAFGPGDNLVVQVKVREGTRERLRPMKGLLLPSVIVASTLRSLSARFLMVLALNELSRRTVR